MHPYCQKELTAEVIEAVNLWRHGVPQNVDLAEVELWFERYDRAINTLTHSENPYHDVVAAEPRVYRQTLQKQVDRRLRATHDLE